MKLNERMIETMEFLQKHGPKVSTEKLRKEHIYGVKNIMSLDSRGLAHYTDREPITQRATAVVLTEAGQKWSK